MKTKIIVTYGPSLSDLKVLKEVLKHADIVRVNFSHGDKSIWLSVMERVNRLAAELGKEIALLADLPGPKVRIGTLPEPIKAKKGDTVTFISGKGISGGIPVQYNLFHNDAKEGAIIEIGDGDARFQIKEIKGRKIISKALEDGIISSRKGVSLLGISMNISSPTQTDMKMARFALKHKFDYLCLSFIKSAKDINSLRKENKSAKIIAKVETKAAVNNINEIAEASDAIMVARGDLALEVSLEHIPEAQMKIISASRNAGKPVIVATQLLASMVKNPMPTRAEVNDIASAVMSGADCLMLSDETTVGKFPIDAVRFLNDTARVAESLPTNRVNPKTPKITSVNMGIAYAAASLADEYRTDCIFIPTQTGSTAKMISQLRPDAKMIALTTNKKIDRMLSIYYGIRTLSIKRYKSMDQMLNYVKSIAASSSIKNYIIVSGSPNKPGSTDTLKYVENK